MKKLKALILGASLIFTHSVIASENSTTNASSYSYVDKQNDSISYSSYLDALNIPKVHTSRQCNKNGDRCWPVIVNQDERVLKSFSSESSLATLASGRYPQQAYLFYQHIYTVGKETYRETYRIDNQGRQIKYDNTVSGTLDTHVSKDGQPLRLETDGLYLDNRLIQESDFGIDKGSISTDLTGAISIIAFNKAGEIYLSDSKKWLSTNNRLSSSGDRNDILAAYPDGKYVYFAFYKYINSYNKGLIYGRTDFASEQTQSGWLFNSEEANVGFSPELYKASGNIVVNATNSTERQSNSFTVPTDSDLNELVNQQLTHTRGYEGEKHFNLLAGYGVSSLSWNAKTKVETNSVEYANTKYDISDSLYHDFWFQGKYGRTQLAVTYGKQKADDIGGITAKASKLLNAVVDVNGLFSPSTSLRLSMSSASIYGVASVNLSDQLSQSQILNEYQPRSTFETKLTEYNLLAMRERGMFIGGSYKHYQMPDMLGFSGSNKSISFVGYDPSLSIKKYGLVFGYDELSYAQRYENKLNRFYIDASGGFSYVSLDVAKELKDEIKERNRKLKSDIVLGVDASFDFGYILQNRSKKLRGLGYSLTAGYRVKGDYYFAGQSDEADKLKPNEVMLEFDRYDIWHGFFASANIIF